MFRAPKFLVWPTPRATTFSKLCKLWKLYIKIAHRLAVYLRLTYSEPKVLGVAHWLVTWRTHLSSRQPFSVMIWTSSWRSLAVGSWAVQATATNSYCAMWLLANLTNQLSDFLEAGFLKHHKTKFKGSQITFKIWKYYKKKALLWEWCHYKTSNQWCWLVLWSLY